MVILKSRCHSKLNLSLAIFQLLSDLTFFLETLLALSLFHRLAVVTILSD